MRWTIGILSFCAGAAIMWVGQTLFPQKTDTTVPPDHYYDLSALPEALAAKFADPAYLQDLIEQEERREKFIAELEEERAARVFKTLPEGVPDMPFEVELYAPKEGSHWPILGDPDLQDALDRHKEDWVILNYWASWCAPCIAELPDMDQAAQKLADLGVHLVPLNVDQLDGDTLETIDEIFSAKAVTQLPKLRASGRDVDAALAAASMTRIRTAYPHNLIFAPGGVPYAYFEGFPISPDHTEVWNSDEMLEFFRALAANHPD